MGNGHRQGVSAWRSSRPHRSSQIHALAVGGISGVAHLLHLLRTELELVMAQLGCSRVEHFVPDLIWCPSVTTP
ncbi:alpha-hydroxy-acid oxidizing protein [Oxalicibacterium flavum]|uniref:alpha-hydroxy-acid oxidizing protein n=1 Tax=Oxalicibacterium flavum TaxID=179467 RepID=UPI00227BBA05|nr:alpha-hydroxy-acid oxidizing protein [Oxalicibacterium flavum]